MTYFPILIAILAFGEIATSSPLQKRSPGKDGSLGADAKAEIQAMIDASIAKSNANEATGRGGTVTVNVSPNKLCPNTPPPLTGIPITSTVFDLDNAVGLSLSQANGNAYCRVVNQKISIGKNANLSIFDHTRLYALPTPLKAGDTVTATYSD